MAKTYFKVQQQFCGECSLALRRFIGGMEGVTSVEAEKGTVAVEFDEGRLTEELVRKITQDSIEKLGYRVEGE